MKWEKVKKHVACQVRDSVIHGASQSWSQILVDELFSDFAVRKGLVTEGVVKERRPGFIATEAYADKAYDVVMNWDVRRADGLRKMFPEYFPKSLCKGLLQANYDDDGDWVIFKQGDEE